MTQAIDAPFASASAEFPLGATRMEDPAQDSPSPGGQPPWGLRNFADAGSCAGGVMNACYDHERQVAVGPDGGRLFWAGAPTAEKTQSVDGEDGPSSTDWINDYHPDEPFQA